MKFIVFIMLFVGLASVTAQAQQDLDRMFATITTDAGTTACSVFVRPDGQGMPFTDAIASGGGSIDATIRLLLTDYHEDPIEGFPVEDMWLGTFAGGMVACPYGTIADGPTDENGETIWTLSPRAGGSSEGETMHGWVSGWYLDEPMPITVNSADINRDLIVDLSDVVLFAQILAEGYDYAADFSFDSAVNLADIVLFVPSIGVSCP